MKENLIVDLTFEFAVRIVDFTELLESKRKINVSNQLFRCGTSIGANVWEAQSAESRADFIHKIKIADKETLEPKLWLLLCKRSRNYPNTDELLQELECIKRVLGKIITTAKSN